MKRGYGFSARGRSWCCTVPFLHTEVFFRLGLQGVGGAEPHFLKGIITGTRENGTVDFKCDLESQRKLQEAFRDKLAGFIGIFFIVFGTFVWGYGDLIGRILSIA